MFEAQIKPMRLDEFIAYALLPENAARNLEFINGEMIEKMPSSPHNSTSAFMLGHILYWEMYPDERLIDVYAPGKALTTYGMDVAIAVDIISELMIPVSKLFC